MPPSSFLHIQKYICVTYFIYYFFNFSSTCYIFRLLSHFSRLLPSPSLSCRAMSCLRTAHTKHHFGILKPDSNSFLNIYEITIISWIAPLYGYLIPGCCWFSWINWFSHILFLASQQIVITVKEHVHRNSLLLLEELNSYSCYWILNVLHSGITVRMR